MTIFNSYIKLPEGDGIGVEGELGKILGPGIVATPGATHRITYDSYAHPSPIKMPAIRKFLSLQGGAPPVFKWIIIPF